MNLVLTTDVDFVSDDFLQLAYEPLLELPLTVFMTGKSGFLEKVFQENRLWEGEPHPNFCSGSTHGNSQQEVFATMENFWGEGLGFRCHKYYSSNNIEEEFSERGFGYASNICTNLENITPFWSRCGILQMPIFFEDGGYLKYHGVPRIADIVKKMTEDGTYIFNFHPIHLALNSCDFFSIRKLKDSMPSDQYSMLSVKEAYRYRNNGYGVADFLNELIGYAWRYDMKFMNLKQYYEECKVICI